jgi:hypothetical protein
VTTDSLGHHDQDNNATLLNKLFLGLNSQRKTKAAEQIAERQMQPHTIQLANSTQQNQSMVDQMQLLGTTISSLQTQMNQGGKGSQGQGQG